MKKPSNHVILWSKISPLLNNPFGSCSLSLKAGLAQRAEHPLPSGLYKLRDAHREMSKCLDEFVLLARLLRAKQQLRGNCTYGDQVPWIKRRPVDISFELGWKVLPAIQALISDGISAKDISKYLPGFIQRVADLVNQCEKTLPQIKGPIRHEYERWRNHSSLITPLFESALGIIESGVHIAESDAFA
jgi:hypothetical protein